MVEMPPRLHARLLTALLAVGLLAAACGGGEQTDGGGGMTTPTPDAAGGMQAILASVDLYAGEPQRVLVGLVFGDGQLVSYGTVSYSFSYTGTAAAPMQPEQGPIVDARYLPTPGTPSGGATPAITLPSEARGVYQADDVTFDRAGYWMLEVTAELPDGTQTATATVPVRDVPALPAPGQQALMTENLVIGDPSAPVAAIDSLAAVDGVVPDADLHASTIADAIARGDVTIVLFATPAYCMSQFCGPVNELVETIAGAYAGRATFIHVEIWRDFQNQVINKAAAEWLYRDGDLTEPWLYLIGRGGTIIDRWGSLFDPDEVRAAVDAALAA